LLVADLYLEKASFFARQGQMLPPYDSRATLDELADLIATSHGQWLKPKTTWFCINA